MRKLLPILGLLAATSAFAADMPVKAPPLNPIYTGYPYGSSGLFYGIYTEGGGGPVNGSATGVASASLVELSAGVGATVGYAWGAKGSPVAYSIEGDVGYTNFNGSVAGFSMGGPLSVEVRGVAFTPLANFTQYLPNLPSWGTVPPFNALPAGVTASHTQIGLMAGLALERCVARLRRTGNRQGVSRGADGRAGPDGAAQQRHGAADLHQERVFQRCRLRWPGADKTSLRWPEQSGARGREPVILKYQDLGTASLL